MYKTLIFFTLMLFMQYSVQAQTNITWNDLSAIQFEQVYNAEYDVEYNSPIFGKVVQDLANEEVVITGYIFPFDLEGNYYILSKFPYKSCFFCGNDEAGPETVIEVKFVKKYRWFKMDDIITVKGKVYLNNKDINQMYYVLKEAEVVSN